ncbi:MAG: beta-L-arabinofuranosidase domain-containing protein, partial [Verrucomicrobiaceae bacterium]
FCIKEGNAWLSKDHRGHGAWEEVPYWLKGFGDLGYVLDDRRIQAETQEWIEAVLASQRADGWFGPLENLESPRIRPNIAGEQVQGRPDLWANALMLSVLRSNYEHTGDQRIVRLMLKFCDWLIALPEKDYLIHWVDKRRGIEHLQNILWLYNVTGEQRLLALAEKAHRRSSDWSSGISRAHNVDFSECFHEPGFYYTLSKDRKDLDSVERNRRTVYDEFGQVPGGMFGGDELMRPGYTDPRQAVETCGMVEMMNACEKMFTQIEGDIRWADRCEDVAFNSFPAALTADMKALRYLTAPNLVVSDRLSKSPDINNGDGMFVMNPHSHRCCQHNHSHGWPYYAEHLWLATPDDGLCAMLYSESTVSARIAGGQTVSVREKTHYPFCDTIEFAISSDAKEAPTNFPLYLRVPGWCASPQLTINGRPVEVSAQPGKYIRIERSWNNGDRIELKLPMHVAVRTWEKNQKSVSVDRGPLTYSLKIEEHYVPGNGLETIKSDKLKNARADFKAWPAFEIFSASPWNFGLVMEDGFKVVERPWPDNDMPWTQSTVPVTLAASARLIPGWKLQKNNLISKIIPSPVKSDAPVSSITLLPMGACRLRLSAFPTIGDAAIAPSAQDR